MSAQKGIIQLLPLIVFAALGVILYVVISQTVDFSQNPLLSKLFPKPPSQAQEQAPSVPDEILVKFKPGVEETTKNKVLTRYGLSNKDITETIPGIEVALLKVPQKAKDRLIEALSKNPNVEYAEPNYIREVQLTPNDTYFPNQWNLTKITAPIGWDISVGSPSAIISVLDTGIDIQHEDLTSKIIGTPNDDVNGHGTLVSGVAGADTNNGKGVAGICWLCPILSLKVLSDSGYGSDSSVATGITTATDRGAKVINMSLGASSFSQTMQNASNYAWSKGLVLVAASGNSNTTVPFYPAANANVVAVGSSTSSDTKSSTSNYGPWLDVVAPGVSILTTRNGGTYSTASGTSLASPHVAGLAGLIFSANSSLTNQQVVDIITSTADDLGDAGFDQYYGWGKINVARALQKATGTTGPLPDNLSPKVTITSPTDGSTVSGIITIKVGATDNVGVTKVIAYHDTNVSSYLIGTDTQAPYEFLWDTKTVADGSHSILVYAYDAAGNAAGASVKITVSNTTTPDTTPPTVSIISPTNGQTVSGNVTISASASDNVAVSSVSFFTDGVFLGEDTTSPYSMVWDTTKESNGNHTIQTKAVDSSSNIGESSIITVSVDNPTPTPSSTPISTPTPTPNPISTPTPTPSDTTPPTVSITSPSDGAIVPRNSTINIQASASDNVKISKVEFSVNNSVKCTDTISPYSCIWKTPGKRGATYTITARAYDSSNNINISAVTITVK